MKLEEVDGIWENVIIIVCGCTPYAVVCLACSNKYCFIDEYMAVHIFLGFIIWN